MDRWMEDVHIKKWKGNSFLLTLPEGHIVLHIHQTIYTAPSQITKLNQ